MSAPVAQDATQAVRLRALVRHVAHAVGLLRRADARRAMRMVVLEVAAGGAVAVQLAAITNLVDGLVASREGSLVQSVVWSALVVMALSLAVIGLQMWTRAQSELLGEAVRVETQRSLLTRVAATPLLDLETSAYHGTFDRISANARTRPLELVQGMEIAASTAATALGALVALFYFQPVLALVASVAMWPLWLSATRRSVRMFQFEVEMTPLERRRSYLVQLLTGREALRELRVFGAEAALATRWEALSSERRVELARTLQRQTKEAAIGSLVYGVAMCAALLLTGLMIDWGWLSVPEGVAAAVALAVVGAQTLGAATGADMILEAAPYLAELEEFLATAPGAAARLASTELEPLVRLDVRDVAFSYPEASIEALAGVTLSVQRGEVIALVGENGSGKSTLVSVMAGLYPPRSGMVLWNGRPFVPGAAGSRVSVAFQQFTDAKLPFRENVALGQVQIDEARIDAVVAATGSWRLAAQLPSGYDTILSPEFEGGADLSGGQWRRVALMRALYRAADLYILDEATAELDGEAAACLGEAVAGLRQDAAVVLVAHRFSAVMGADRIYVLREGTVVENGTHDELWAAGGEYRRLFERQESLDRSGSDMEVAAP